LIALRDWGWRALRGEDPWMPAPSIVGRDLLQGWGDEWLVQPREELRLLQLCALEAAGQRLLMGGRLGEATILAGAAVSLDPLRESSNRLLIDVHLREGNRLEALRQYSFYEDLLSQETGTTPSLALTSLVRAATTGDPTSSDLLHFEGDARKPPGTAPQPGRRAVRATNPRGRVGGPAHRKGQAPRRRG
jgi:DNA-binding SARP family transcriptional activator